MKKSTFALILFLILASAYLAFGQDTLFEHAGRTFVMEDQPIDCFPFACNVAECATVNIADTGCIVMNFGSIGADFSISVIKNDRFVLLSECAFIGPATPSYQIERIFPDGSSIMVCGAGSDSIYIFYKAVPFQNYPPFGPPIIDMDTLCTIPTNIESKAERPRRLVEFDGRHWRHVAVMRPNMLYKEY